MIADDATRIEIIEALTKWAEGYFQKDVEGLLRLHCCQPGLVAVGTGIDEVRLDEGSLRDGLQRSFAQSDSISISFSDVSVSRAGSVAWAYAACTARVRIEGVMHTLSGRFTSVLARSENRWLFAQTHLSVAASGQAPGQSFATDAWRD